MVGSLIRFRRHRTLRQTQSRVLKLLAGSTGLGLTLLQPK